MNIVSSPFAVRLDEVRAVFNSHNEAMLEHIKHTLLYDAYAPQLDDLEGALRHIIFGKPRTGKPQEYGYALMCICSCLGQALTFEQCEVFLWGENTEEVNMLLNRQGVSPNIDDMIKPIYTFDIPVYEGWPAIGGYTREEVAQLQVQLARVSVSPPDEDDFDEVQWELWVFKRAVAYCAEKGMDWVTFVH